MSWRETFWAILGGYAVVVVAIGTYFLLGWLHSFVFFSPLAPMIAILTLLLPLSAFFAVPIALGMLLGWQSDSEIRDRDDLKRNDLKIECFWVACFWWTGFCLAIMGWVLIKRPMTVELFLHCCFSAVLSGTFVALIWAPIICRTILWGIDFKHHRLADELSGNWSRGEK